MSSPSFNIGIEEEYQTIESRLARLAVTHPHAEIVQKGKTLLAERVKPEMHQSVIEIGTRVCRNIKEAREEIRSIRKQIVTLARQNGLRQPARIRSRSGAHRRFTLTIAAAPLSRICGWWPART
jgi:carboxylate-amine ligase